MRQAEVDALADAIIDEAIAKAAERLYVARIQPDRTVTILSPLEPNVESRILQEEVWAQTSWPTNEVPLTELLRAYQDGRLGELVTALKSDKWLSLEEFDGH